MAHYLGELTESNMKNLQALVDSNSVIGKEIVTHPGGAVWRRHRRRGHHYPHGLPHRAKRRCEADTGAKLQ